MRTSSRCSTPGSSGSWWSTATRRSSGRRSSPSSPASGSGRPDGGRDRMGFPQEEPEAQRGRQPIPGHAHGKGTSSATRSSSEYLQSTKYVRNALQPAEHAKFQRPLQLFQKYGDQVRLRLADARGAGLPGVAPRPEGEEPRRSGRRDAGDARDRQGAASATSTRSSPNIHAGTKYLRDVLDRYFADALDGLNRELFAFASYNAGPAKVARLRKEAEQRGLDPNVWFHNVERSPPSASATSRSAT